jgi:hypothetical protein
MHLTKYSAPRASPRRHNRATRHPLQIAALLTFSKIGRIALRGAASDPLKSDEMRRAYRGSEVRVEGPAREGRLAAERALRKR